VAKGTFSTSNEEKGTLGVSSAVVLQKLEHAIVSGYFKPRERLVERDLLTHFGVSRTVIREVLKKLEGKGLVKITPYRGAAVADLTVEEVEEIYFLRLKLEAIAAHLSAKNITQTQIQHLNMLCEELEGHRRKRTDQMFEKYTEFHRAMSRASGNRYLGDMIDYLRTKAYIVRFNAWSTADRLEQSTREHKAMIRALEQRDARALERLVTDHLLFSKNTYLAQLRGVARRGMSEKRWDPLREFEE